MTMNTPQIYAIIYLYLCMVYFIILVFIVGFLTGLCYGCNFLADMINSPKQKDRDWANDLINRKKKHGTL